MLVIVGASGCGKSTLLRLVAGLERPTAGRVVLGGRDVTQLDPSERDIAMVFQNYALYPHMTVFDNMAYGLRIRGLSRDEIRRRVDEAAALLGLGELLARKPRQLSGGQRQRVAMGRAIVRHPKLFLFDEPLSNLDAKLRLAMRAEIRRLQRRLGVTSLYRDPRPGGGDDAGRPAAGPAPGQAGPACHADGGVRAPGRRLRRRLHRRADDEFPAPPSWRAEGRRRSWTAGPLMPFADGRRPGRTAHALTVGIRPEHLEPGPDGFDLADRPDRAAWLGNLVHGHLAGGEEQSLVVRLAVPAPPGERLTVRPHHGICTCSIGHPGQRIDPIGEENMATPLAAADTAD